MSGVICLILFIIFICIALMIAHNFRLAGTISAIVGGFVADNVAKHDSDKSIIDTQIQKRRTKSKTIKDHSRVGGYRVVPIMDAAHEGDVEYEDEIAGEMKTYNVRSRSYRDWRSDEQIRSIVRAGNSDEFARLCRIITKYLGHGAGRAKIISSLPYKTDTEIYKEICGGMSRDEEQRGIGQATAIYRIIKHMVDVNTVAKYLDVGCGNGSITRELTKMIKEGRDNADEIAIHCIEVDVPADGAGIEYHKVDPTEPKRALPYADSTFDLITANMALHHIEHINEMVGELYRVMKPGGRLFIREHDCWNSMDAMLVDIEHAIYSNCLEGRPLGVSYGGQNYYCAYRNYNGWDTILSRFKYIKGDYYSPGLRNDISPTRAYWSVYEKAIDDKK